MHPHHKVSKLPDQGKRLYEGGSSEERPRRSCRMQGSRLETTRSSRRGRRAPMTRSTQRRRRCSGSGLRSTRRRSPGRTRCVRLFWLPARVCLQCACSVQPHSAEAWLLSGAGQTLSCLHGKPIPRCSLHGMSGGGAGSREQPVAEAVASTCPLKASGRGTSWRIT